MIHRIPRISLCCLFVLLGGIFAVGLYGEAALAAAPLPDAVSEVGWIADLLNGPARVPQGGELILMLGVVALATLITEDLTCVITGLMIANGTLTWTQGIGACLLGILFGDFLLFLAGKKWGRPALRRAPLRWMIHPLKLLKTEEWFRRRGGVTILISRFMPGTRLPAYVAAGLMGMSYSKFLLFFVVAALLWTPALVFMSYKLAGKALRLLEEYHHAAPWVFLGMVVFYLLVFKVMVPSLNWRGRRQLLARWRRFTRPEYWPAFLFYFPVLLYLCSRWLRREKHPMDFSACNPCIPGGGVVEESKSDILDRFGDREAVADYVLIAKAEPPEKKIEWVISFMRERGLDFPLVLKPDVGQRGSQVVIAKSMEEVKETLHEVKVDFLVQTFVPGIEFGVFYIRHPDQECGRIFAITRKTFCVLTGDGEHSLEELILGHPRAMCQAEMHCQNLRSRLLEIPKKGERVQLTQVGNHARGTLFEDGIDLVTPALTARMEEISRSLPDFYFGRYDLMAADVESFQRGEGLKVIELNGVSSEATSLYDPKYSYFSMAGTLLRQWREASAIGAALQAKGHPRMKIRTLIHQYDQYLQRETRRHLAAKRNDKRSM
ncbi:VTT domain-containing protein [Kiritimatiellaeota bacterium B1221]|nr:VTT domain-containing protein [Kiritimatiellaeota bacterium B1221]